MTPQFLREEAARFRGMADTMEREASRLRLLAMATDYESRATLADGVSTPVPTREIPADAIPVEANSGEAVPGGVIKIKLARKTRQGMNEAG
jgi:hypothetical protein